MSPYALLIPIISIIGFFSTLIWIAYVVLEAIRTRHRARVTSELQAKLLERITSVNELGAFLNTEAGAQFLKRLQVESVGPHDRVLRAMQTGIVLMILGAALFVWGWFSFLPEVPRPVATGFYGLATIFLALGVGFLISAALAWRLSKQLGLVDGEQDRNARQSMPTV